MGSIHRARHAALLALVAHAVIAPAAARARGAGHVLTGTIALDGATRPVRWVDGDTFQFVDGPRSGTRARLEGFNTLESYGPVHRWGTWRAEELQVLAHEATVRATARTWACTARTRLDRYRRLLVWCPDLALDLVRSGHAMAFAMGRASPRELLAAQHDAQRRRVGMWAKGVPAQLVSSVHSVAERGGHAAYDRVVDTRTGEARAVPHERTYRTCEEVCSGDGEDRSCMLYVPFERRHRGRPRCLRTSEPAGQDEAVRQGRH